MRLTRETMLDRMLASDATYDGKFITGVLSTGIYCIPSCRARKPKPENVRFFETPDEARAAGLRACLKCRPDERLAGIDPELDRLVEVVGLARRHPEHFSTVDDLAREYGYGVSTLTSAMRKHYQDSPGSFLLGARIEVAKNLLLAGDLEAGEVGLAVGFDSTSGFYESFKKQTGMSPGAYARLRTELSFEASLPDEYPVCALLDALGRHPDSVSERRVGNVYEVAVEVEGRPLVATYDFSPVKVRCSVKGEAGDGAFLHHLANRIVGWDRDPSPFEALAERVGHPELVDGQRGTRIPQTPTFWDGLCWVVIGQQISLPFAFQLRRSLALLFHAEGGLVPIPSPAKVAAMDVEDLVKIKFSHRKAEYLIDIARLVLNGDLAEESVRCLPATRVEEKLLAIRGLGPWSANYLMMRSLAFADCVPVGDTGLNSGLRKLLGIDHKLAPAETQSLMLRFAPYRSLATYHLWQSLKTK